MRLRQIIARAANITITTVTVVITISIVESWVIGVKSNQVVGTTATVAVEVEIVEATSEISE